MSFPEEPIRTLEVFISYADEDSHLQHDIEKQLINLKRQNIIKTWHKQNISAGEEIVREIDSHLSTAHIILLLVSPDFVASDYCYSIHVKRALARHERGEAHIIPIILRPTYWKDTLFGHLKALPSKVKVKGSRRILILRLLTQHNQ